MESKSSSALTFPCEFVIKVMGKNHADLEPAVLSIIQKQFPVIEQHQISRRPSKDANYLALSITVTAENQAQLDATYQGLTDSDQVIMAL